jgi:hypothetical protein
VRQATDRDLVELGDPDRGLRQTDRAFRHTRWRSRSHHDPTSFPSDKRLRLYVRRGPSDTVKRRNTSATQRVALGVVATPAHSNRSVVFHQGGIARRSDDPLSGIEHVATANLGAEHILASANGEPRHRRPQRLAANGRTWLEPRRGVPRPPGLPVLLSQLS